MSDIFHCDDKDQLVRVTDSLGASVTATYDANGSRLSEARRNKFLMAARVESHGKRTAAQCCSPDLDVLLTWIDRHAGSSTLSRVLRAMAVRSLSASAPRRRWWQG